MLIPKDNVKDLEEIPANVKNGLEIVPVKWIDEILPIALVSDPMKRNEIKVGDVTSELVAPKIETADIASQN